MVPNEDDRQAVYVAPPADVESTDVGYVIRAEMPGVEKDGLEITFDRGELIILGRRKPIEVTGELIYREIGPHDLARLRARSIDRFDEDYRKYRPRDLDRYVTKSRNRQTSQDRCAMSYAQ